MSRTARLIVNSAHAASPFVLFAVLLIWGRSYFYGETWHRHARNASGHTVWHHITVESNFGRLVLSRTVAIAQPPTLEEPTWRAYRIERDMKVPDLVSRWETSNAIYSIRVGRAGTPFTDLNLSRKDWLYDLGFATGQTSSLEYFAMASRRYVMVPYWFLALATAILPARRLTFAFKRRRGSLRAARDHCPTCGYDVRANSGQCPECGESLKFSHKIGRR